MAYLTTAATFRPTFSVDPLTGGLVAGPVTGRGTVVFTASDATHAAVNIATTAGVNGTSYPLYTRASGSWITDGFVVGDYVRVTGAASDVNGSTAAPKVWRIASLTATVMGVEGTGTSAITTVSAAAGITVRKVRVFRVADLRSIHGAAHPVTLWAASSTNLSGTKLQASLDDCLTFVDVPNVILPDTNNNSAQMVNFVMGYEVLLMVVPGNVAGPTIYAA
jgi:hypothetical protein